MSEWQPIETAPRDGSSIIAYSKRIGIEKGFINPCTANYKKIHVQISGSRKSFCATHWMPLPNPPIVK